MSNLNIALQAEVAMRAQEQLNDMGLDITYAMLGRNYSDPEYGPEVSFRVESATTAGKYMFDKDREEKVNLFLEAYPDSLVERKSDYGKPDMLVSWFDSGVRVEVNFGSGVCEKRQVGVKKVDSYDPVELVELSKVTIEEPIYEYFCPDPILN